MVKINEYIQNEAELLHKYNLNEFFTNLHINYYSTIDISFME